MTRTRRPPLANLQALLRHPFSSLRRKTWRTEALWREYAAWIARFDTLGDRDRAEIAAHIARLADPPRISVLMPVHDPPVDFLRQAIASVTGQLYPHWQFCIADDASADPAVRALLGGLDDARIRLVQRPSQGGISAASNSALEVAEGDWIALLDHDDRLAPHALYLIAAEICAHPDAAMVFSDEDAINEAGLRFQPNFKSDWNEELMLGQNAFSHLGAFRSDDVRALGGFRGEVDGSQDWDLVLRMADRVGAERIRHVPHVLYHWRQGAPGQFSQSQSTRASAAGARAVRDHLARRGEASAEVGRVGVWLQVVHAAPSPLPPVAAIVVATNPARLARSVAAILASTGYAPFRLLVVAGEAERRPVEAALSRFAGDARLEVLPSQGSNPVLSRNLAAEKAGGGLLVFLDEGLTPLDAGWLEPLVAQVARTGVAAAGALIVDPAGRLIHSGFLLNPESIAVSPHAGRAAGGDRHFGLTQLAHDVPAVSGACLATRHDLFRDIGGFDPALPGLGDVDYCLRLRELGHRIVWSPLARMRQARRRQRDHGAEESALMRQRWTKELAEGGGNPNLSPDGTFALAVPPRARKPWRDEGPFDPL